MYSVSKLQKFPEVRGFGSTKGLPQGWLDIEIIGCSSLSGIVPAGYYKLNFSCYLHHQFFNRHLFRAGHYKISPAASLKR